ESLRVSYGVLNLTHRDGHENPAVLAAGERYRIRIQLNDMGSAFPAGHKARLAISTAYWPMIWPSPETATVQIIAGTLDLPRRSPNLADAKLLPFPEPETAPPEKPTILHRDGVRIERIDRIGLELGTQWNTQYHVEENDPLSAVAELRNTQTLSRNEWQIRVETQMRLSSTADAFLLQGSLRAFEGANEVCRRDWNRSIPRDFS
ncbi:MAG: CocE/NonD family hydrolase C-terminal non-catalytic domain-containing protein, partial [Xanthobacteraceae bacterium]